MLNEVEVQRCLLLLVDDTSYFGKALIRGLLVTWIVIVVDVVRYNGRIMYVKHMIGKWIGNIVSAYAPQMGLTSET